MNNETQFIVLLFYFLVFGIVLRLCYEPVRILRVIIKHNNIAIGIEDIIYLTLCGPLLFGFSMEVGNGQFRFLFLISAVIGALIYHLTIGRLFKAIYTPVIEFIISLFKIPIMWIKKIVVLISQKTGLFFVSLYKKSSAYIKSQALHLQSRRKIKYNNNNIKEERNDNFGRAGRIKAKIDKQ